MHDLLDINVLRCAKEDLDSTYKTVRIVNWNHSMPPVNQDVLMLLTV